MRHNDCRADLQKRVDLREPLACLPQIDPFASVAAPAIRSTRRVRDPLARIIHKHLRRAPRLRFAAVVAGGAGSGVGEAATQRLLRICQETSWEGEGHTVQGMSSNWLARLSFGLGAAGMFATVYCTQAILPTLGRVRGKAAQTGLTISVVVVASGSRAWIWGPLSDRIGKRCSSSPAGYWLLRPWPWASPQALLSCWDAGFCRVFACLAFW